MFFHIKRLLSHVHLKGSDEVRNPCGIFCDSGWGIVRVVHLQGPRHDLDSLVQGKRLIVLLFLQADHVLL